MYPFLYACIEKKTSSTATLSLPGRKDGNCPEAVHKQLLSGGIPSFQLEHSSRIMDGEERIAFYSGTVRGLRTFNLSVVSGVLEEEGGYTGGLGANLNVQQQWCQPQLSVFTYHLWTYSCLSGVLGILMTTTAPRKCT